MENNNTNISNQSPKINNNESKKRVSLFLNPFFHWVLLTVIYSLFMIFQWHYIVGIIGLFVPLGPFSLIFLFGGAFLLWLGSLSLIIFVIWFFSKIIKKWNINPIVNVLLIFVILFLLTIVVDYIFYGEWKSLEIFQHGGNMWF